MVMVLPTAWRACTRGVYLNTLFASTAASPSAVVGMLLLLLLLLLLLSVDGKVSLQVRIREQSLPPFYMCVGIRTAM